MKQLSVELSQEQTAPGATYQQGGRRSRAARSFAPRPASRALRPIAGERRPLGIYSSSMIDWAIIIAYVALALAVGVWFSKRASSSTNEYFLSGRTLPWWVLGTSMAATTFAADTPLAITELVRTEGIWRNWFWWNVALQGLLAAFFFAPLWRRARVVTDQELIELRYSGRRAAFLRAFKALYFAVIQNCLVMSWVIAGMSTVLSVLLDVPETIAVTGCLAVALVYSVLSGFWGVVATDLVQYLVAVVGATILAVIAVSHVGGMDALTEALARSETSPAHLMDFFPPLTAEGTSWLDAPFFKVAVYLTVVWWASQNVEGGGYIVQRMSAARDERHALLGTLWFNLCNFAVRSWPWIMVALVSLVLFPDLSDHPLGEKAGYPLVIDAVLGPGLRGLLVVSFLAAFMSTIDTHLNWGASYLINDVYRRFIRPAAGERHCVMVSRLCVVALVVLAGVGSLFVGSISGLWELVWALGCGLGPVLVLRWFWWRVSAVSEIARARRVPGGDRADPGSGLAVARGVAPRLRAEFAAHPHQDSAGGALLDSLLDRGHLPDCARAGADPAILLPAHQPGRCLGPLRGRDAEGPGRVRSLGHRQLALRAGARLWSHLRGRIRRLRAMAAVPGLRGDRSSGLRLPLQPGSGGSPAGRLPRIPTDEHLLGDWTASGDARAGSKGDRVIRAIVFDFGRVITAQKPESLFRRYEEDLGLAPGSLNTLMFESQAWREALLGDKSFEEFWIAIGPAIGLDTAEAIHAFRSRYMADEAVNRKVLQLIQPPSRHAQARAYSRTPHRGSRSGSGTGES